MPNELTTWRDEVTNEMTAQGDPGPLLAVSPNEDVFNERFDAGFGGTNGPQFLAWTEQRVYFPVNYDGAESAGSAPRNPVPLGQQHVGGG